MDTEAGTWEDWRFGSAKVGIRKTLIAARHDVFVRETVAGLLCQARRDAGGRELRGLAWRMGVAPIG
jgi:hypothetical protein